MGVWGFGLFWCWGLGLFWGVEFWEPDTYTPRDAVAHHIKKQALEYLWNTIQDTTPYHTCSRVALVMVAAGYDIVSRDCINVLKGKGPFRFQKESSKAT